MEKSKTKTLVFDGTNKDAIEEFVGYKFIARTDLIGYQGTKILIGSESPKLIIVKDDTLFKREDGTIGVYYGTFHLKVLMRHRKEYNLLILQLLKECVEKYPQQRFGQILANYAFPNYRTQDMFFDESGETYENLAKLFVEPLIIEEANDRNK